MTDTNDFLKRLEASGGIGLDMSPGCYMCEQAAKEIKRLRTALQRIIDAEDPEGMLYEAEQALRGN
jgi:hypothetical protein